MCVILVGKPPEVVEGLQDVSVTSPATASFKCRISPGDPAATITWYRNGRHISPSQRFVYSYEEAEASLTIHAAQPSDEGSYMCKAENKLGIVDTEATLTVNGQSCMHHKGFSFNAIYHC